MERRVPPDAFRLRITAVAGPMYSMTTNHRPVTSKGVGATN